MARKVNRGIYITQDLDAKLDADHINVSELAQDLFEAYFAYGDVEVAAEHTQERRRERRRVELRRACDALKGIDEDQLTRWNPAIINWASKVELPPEDVIAVLDHYKETGEIVIETGLDEASPSP